MSADCRSPDAASAGLDPRAHPELRAVLHRIGHELDLHGTLGLVSITVLHRSGADRCDWSGYEETRRQVSWFLSKHLRRSDILLEPLVCGNTFVALLGAPRLGRELEDADLRAVQARIGDALHAYLVKEPQRKIARNFRLHVGAALVRQEAGVDCGLLIHRSLESAIADAQRDGAESTAEAQRQIREVLDNELIETVYQPLVDLTRRSIIGLEALTRVPGPFAARPDLLFRAARKCGLLWQLERACHRRALSCLPEIGGEQLLFLNVEPESLEDPELLGPAFAARLREAGLAPERVVLEITEHTRHAEFSALRRNLARCREAGFRLAVDDVGAGYSGLLSIAEVEPDYLKVDMSLVRDLHLRRVKRELIRTISRFAENIGITLVAEGVETRDELGSLASLGVRCAQGYLFAKPGNPPLTPEWEAFEQVLA